MQVEDEEENMGDVDLWALANNGAALTVDSRWLAHLQDRLLGEDGHPRKVRVYVCRGGGGGEGGRVPAQDVYVCWWGGREKEGGWEVWVWVWVWLHDCGCGGVWG